MNFLTTISLLASILLPASLAMPTARQECHPNFAGRPVSIFPVTIKELGPGTLEDQGALSYQNRSLEVGEFYIPFTGQPDDSYHIKSVFAPANNFYATVRDDAPWVIWEQNDNGFGSPWYINCAWCSPPTWNTTYALGCAIVSHQGLCLDDDWRYDVPTVKPCEGSQSQVWSLHNPR